MLDHPVVDAALGLIFFYVIMSLFVSAIQEWIATLFSLRSKSLKSGIARLIGNRYAEKVYGHPLIGNMAKQGKLPSYISPETLSAVVLEVFSTEQDGTSYAERTADDLRDLIGKIPKDHPLKGILGVLLADGENAAQRLKEELAGWLDEGMTRVSGWYGRRAKLFIVVIAACATVALNADTIHIVKALWSDDALRTALAAQAQGQGALPEGMDAQTILTTFPIGWGSLPASLWDGLVILAGWFITVAAISLGAPFWFDLLGKVANLKGVGGTGMSRSPGKAKAG